MQKIDIDNLNPIIKELLKLRGVVSKEDIFDFFFQDIYSLSNPFNIRDMNAFVDRLKEAIEYNEKILIYGDKDADGVTAASIIYNTLKAVTKNVEAFVPNHEVGYGLSKDVIESYANSGVSLIITVDCGISNVEEVEFAREHSIDIIVTDHHDIPEILPNAYLIFNPKLLNTGFVSKNFSGCAVAFKLMQAFVFSYTKLYNKDIIILDYEIDKNTDKLKRIRALKATNFVYSDDVFGFELVNNDNAYKSIYLDYYEEFLSEDEVLEELASYMFEGENVVLVLTGGEIRLKKLLRLYEKYELYLPEYDNVYDLLQLGANYGGVNIKSVKTLDEFALLLKVNIYKYDNILYRDLIIKMEIFRRMYYLSQKQLQNYIKRESILVLFGTVADVVPLIEENRAYIKCALPEYALRLLTSETREEAFQLSEEVYNLNETRKSLTESNFNIVCEYIKENNCMSYPIIIVKSDLIDRGLTGLIAGKVLSQYGKTAVILYESKEDGVCTGSIRSRGDDNARDMLEYSSVYLDKFGGHKNAAGFTVSVNNFEKFAKKIIKYASEENFNTSKDEKTYDLELDFKDINMQFAEYLELFEPYGFANEEPVFFTNRVTINSIEKINKNNKIHLKLQLQKNSSRANAIIWSSSEEECSKLEASNFINISYKIKINRFNGSKEVKIYIENYEIN